jgi:NADPH:quinone reductase-like Zn-dependent oxidoreductase
MKDESNCCPPYGDPEVPEFEGYPDPVPGPGEVLVRVAATNVNPTLLKLLAAEKAA